MLEIRRLSEAGGAEIVGIDLREPANDEVRSELSDAWDRHKLLLFRNQHLSKEQHVRFVNIFGDVCTLGRSTSRIGIADGVSHVSNVPVSGATDSGVGELSFHRDHSYYMNPARGITLNGIEVPPPEAGGDTLFANQRLAYNALPVTLRDRLEGLIVQHQSAVDEKHPILDSSDLPAVRKDPFSGDIALHISKRHVSKIHGLSDESTAALLDELTPYMESPEFTYRHSWRAGDLIVWDNAVFLHAREDYDNRHPRNLRRILVA